MTEERLLLLPPRVSVTFVIRPPPIVCCYRCIVVSVRVYHRVALGHIVECVACDSYCQLEEPCIFHFLVGLAFHVHKITPYITKRSRSPKRTHQSQIDNSAQALQEFLVVSLWHKIFQVPLLCKFLRCYLVCDLSVIFRTWSKRSRLDNAIDNAQKIHSVMALGIILYHEVTTKTTVKPTTNCRIASGACF